MAVAKFSAPVSVKLRTRPLLLVGEEKCPAQRRSNCLAWNWYGIIILSQCGPLLASEVFPRVSINSLLYFHLNEMDVGKDDAPSTLSHCCPSFSSLVFEGCLADRGSRPVARLNFLSELGIEWIIWSFRIELSTLKLFSIYGVSVRTGTSSSFLIVLFALGLVGFDGVILNGLYQLVRSSNLFISASRDKKKWIKASEKIYLKNGRKSFRKYLTKKFWMLGKKCRQKKIKKVKKILKIGRKKFCEL